MARMYSGKKGKHGSKKPAIKRKPSWVKMKKEEIEALVVELAKQRKTYAMKDFSNVPDAKIALSRISEDPGPFCMSFGFELDPLVRSIEKIGLIHPPWVVGGDGDRLDVVMGHRRILALKALKSEQAPMKDLSALGLKPLDLLLLNLYDNLSVRPFNAVEKGMILNRLKPHLSGETILKEYMPLLGLQSREKARTLYEKLEEISTRYQQRYNKDEELKNVCGDITTLLAEKTYDNLSTVRTDLKELIAARRIYTNGGSKLWYKSRR